MCVNVNRTLQCRTDVDLPASLTCTVRIWPNLAGDYLTIIVGKDKIVLN